MTVVGELDSVAKCVAALYRMFGNTSADGSLVLRGESADDVAYQLLTRGCRAAQRWMLNCGYIGWRARSTALSFAGSDATTGGVYASLPSDFLRGYAPRNVVGTRSALVQANGDRWGTETHADNRQRYGDFYYYFDTSGVEQLWLTRSAAPPAAGLYLEYHQQHAGWTSSVTITFPLECRHLIISEAASIGKDESWFPGDQALQQSIERNLQRDREQAQDYARRSKAPRAFRRPSRFGNY